MLSLLWWIKLLWTNNATKWTIKKNWAMRTKGAWKAKIGILGWLNEVLDKTSKFLYNMLIIFPEWRKHWHWIWNDRKHNSLGSGILLIFSKIRTLIILYVLYSLGKRKVSPERLYCKGKGVGRMDEVRRKSGRRGRRRRRRRRYSLRKNERKHIYPLIVISKNENPIRRVLTAQWLFL